MAKFNKLITDNIFLGHFFMFFIVIYIDKPGLGRAPESRDRHDHFVLVTNALKYNRITNKHNNNNDRFCQCPSLLSWSDTL